MKKWLPAVFLNLFAIPLYAQRDSVSEQGAVYVDTVKALPQVTVHAYEQYGPILTLPAAVNVIRTADLEHDNNVSILSAVNAAPGVRMEERSPGSYRFGIRGSSLESPFGVRNIRVYYNGIPYTDPSGNTYLNQLGFYNITSLEIIKGPGSSMYGAGTGGVLLISSMPEQWQPGATINYTGGSYGLSNVEGEVRFGDTSTHNIIRYQHVASDGYRQQSAMHNDVLSWDGEMKAGTKNELSVHFLYGDLYYQTPGALTLQEYNADATEARPATPTAPGAVAAQAAIFQKTFLAGFSDNWQIAKNWSNMTTVYGVYATQLNPNLRNYSRTSEPSFGGRTAFTYKVVKERSSVQWVTGCEVQQEFADDRTYNNVKGDPQNLQTDQEIANGALMGFTQLMWQTGAWVFEGGVSINNLDVKLITLSAAPSVDQGKTYGGQLAPRIAILNRLSDDISVYADVEKGFSPPTISELAPTGSDVNFGLNPEQGWNYEIGLRGYALKQKLYFDINVFYFILQNTIVERRDSSGGDHYTNSGGTRQGGVEAYLKYRLKSSRFANTFIRLGYSGYSFQYDKFVQLGNDYSGKQLPGTPANSVSAGLAIDFTFGAYVAVDYYFCDRIALNDANTAYAAPYSLLSAKVGYKRQLRKFTFDLYAGANNILDQKYSLGNDINAVNGRYYNAAAPLNFYAGLSLGYLR